MAFQYKDQRDRGLRRPFTTYPSEGMPVLRKTLVKSNPGYDVWEEVYQFGPTTRPRDVGTMLVARTKSGHYIGVPDQAKYLVEGLGIAPEPRKLDSQVCSIGYSAKSGKWYGWSHRAIYGFRPGDVVKPGDCHAEKIPPGTIAHNEDEAKWFADAFAESVR